ncbi:hypothetical protein KCM76_17385 [Zooshikella marina]|uniref:hypothetical protein n=1 Tax=Zooshikella ganghwensis TaxID=202772 RepID=UPI0004828B07|nr:hypothetical protein [Zooshikella ganghwensis]MBU2707770.1 hypothetical protein [Zooshikella ganghwensis]
MNTDIDYANRTHSTCIDTTFKTTPILTLVNCTSYLPLHMSLRHILLPQGMALAKTPRLVVPSGETIETYIVSNNESKVQFSLSHVVYDYPTGHKTIVFISYEWQPTSGERLDVQYDIWKGTSRIVTEKRRVQKNYVVDMYNDNYNLRVLTIMSVDQIAVTLAPWDKSWR